MQSKDRELVVNNECSLSALKTKSTCPPGYISKEDLKYNVV